MVRRFTNRIGTPAEDFLQLVLLPQALEQVLPALSPLPPPLQVHAPVLVAVVPPVAVVVAAAVGAGKRFATALFLAACFFKLALQAVASDFFLAKPAFFCFLPSFAKSFFPALVFPDRLFFNSVKPLRPGGWEVS